ncbi:MAG: NUDIX hydrolase [Clostridia bacterium]|nr:NUDIX hydrolase [Clostridia bacterium]
MKLVKVEQLTNSKWLNYFCAKFIMNNGKETDYFFASRRKLENLEMNKNNLTDAIKVLPYYYENGKIYVVLNYEFRPVINGYIYDLCAGLVESQNNPFEDVKKELYEELGATAKNIKKITDSAYTTVGLTDETMACFSAEIESFGTQHLEDEEDITLKTIELSQIPEFVENHKFGATGALLLLMFYYQNINSYK